MRLEPPCVGCYSDVLKRHPGVPVFDIVQNRVALAERAAFGVLAGQADAETFGAEAGEGERLSRRPIQRLFAASHAFASLENFFDLGMRLKIRGQFRLSLQ